jgi:hypothetical protein
VVAGVAALSGAVLLLGIVPGVARVLAGWRGAESALAERS